MDNEIELVARGFKYYRSVCAGKHAGCVVCMYVCCNMDNVARQIGKASLSLSLSLSLS